MSEQLDTLLSEKRRFDTTAEFAARSASTAALYAAGEDWQRFWETEAKALEWSTPWTKVLDWQIPHAKWFVGGKLNASVNWNRARYKDLTRIGCYYNQLFQEGCSVVRVENGATLRSQQLDFRAHEAHYAELRRFAQS